MQVHVIEFNEYMSNTIKFRNHTIGFTQNLYKSMKHLYLLTRLLGISSFRFVDSDFQALSFEEVLCRYVQILVMVGSQTYSMHGRVRNIYPKLTTPQLVVDCFNSQGITLLAATAVFTTLTRRGSEMLQFLRNLIKVDLCLFETQKERIPFKKTINSRCILFCAVNFTSFVLDVLTWYWDAGFVDFHYYLAEYFIILYLYVLPLQIEAYISLIGDRFKAVNSRLLKVGHAFEHGRAFGDLRTLSVLHSTVCDLIPMINRVYGFQMALFVGCETIALIMILYNLLGFIGSGVGSVGSFGMLRLGIQVVLVVSLIALGVMVARQCDLTIEECNETKMVIRHLILTKYYCPSDDKGKRMYKQLLLLKQQVSEADLKFSAAGFFDMDYTMINIIFWGVTTYLIILMQFSDTGKPSVEKHGI